MKAANECSQWLSFKHIKRSHPSDDTCKANALAVALPLQKRLQVGREDSDATELANSAS